MPTVKQRFASCCRTGLAEGLRTSLWLLKFMIPVSLGVTLLAWTGALQWAAGWLRPAFVLLGLPPESVVAFLSAALLNIYSGIAAMGRHRHDRPAGDDPGDDDADPAQLPGRGRRAAKGRHPHLADAAPSPGGQFCRRTGAELAASRRRLRRPPQRARPPRPQHSGRCSACGRFRRPIRPARSSASSFR